MSRTFTNFLQVVLIFLQVALLINYFLLTLNNQQAVYA